MEENIKQVVSKIKIGDQAAFKWLVENYQQRVFSLAFRIICNDEEARDITQESFVKVWQKIESFNEELSFFSWLYKIVTNCAIDKLRVKKRYKYVSLDQNTENQISYDFNDLDKELDNKEMGQLINALVDELPEKQRLIFVMRDLQRFSSKETEETLNLSDTAVKSNLYYARINIRNKLLELMKERRKHHEM